MTPPTKVAISLREMKAVSKTIEIPLFLVLSAFISRSEMATFQTFVGGVKNDYWISKIASTSTAAPVGNWAKPTALRAW